MINSEQIKERLQRQANLKHVEVSGDGRHYQVTVVSDVFEGKSKVARQQWIYSCLNDWIQSGTLHAITMSTWTINEWEKQHG